MTRTFVRSFRRRTGVEKCKSPAIKGRNGRRFPKRRVSIPPHSAKGLGICFGERFVITAASFVPKSVRLLLFINVRIFYDVFLTKKNYEAIRSIAKRTLVFTYGMYIFGLRADKKRRPFLNFRILVQYP